MSTKFHTCVYAGCNNSRVDNPAITFFKFPQRNQDQLEQWINATGNLSLITLDVDSKNRVVCEEHFHKEHILTGPNRKKTLLRNAVPIKFGVEDEFSKYLSSI